ncbi:MAG: PH domain-containing protein [Daejeonella sp.]|uniref:PH domain-containing protein n=1 Tax=Daejeonella sp. TaxID=2805397 RepID=UPI002732BF39|nr:PH domain-containing protein [Daejeonella sp.]MDP3469262.1 PH domain-containing protein [Daejeonella sp.]
MLIEQYLTDDQDPRTAEKVLGKLRDMLTSGEAVIYLAIQKKPAVTLIPDCIAVTNKRIVFCIPENLGLTMTYKTFPWAEVKEVSFKEEFFGSKFITIPQRGENIAIDFIPKVQARKLYQFCNEQLEKAKTLPGFEGKISVLQNENLGDDYASYIEVEEQSTSAITELNVTDAEDEITQKLQKLKILYEKQLISQEEYENKKAEILARL